MTANDIIGDARVARVRELKTALAAAKAQLAQVEAERDALLAHTHLAAIVLRDFEQLAPDGQFRIIDGWNAILRGRNVSKLTSEDISRLKAEYLAGLGIAQLVKSSNGRHSPAPASSVADERDLPAAGSHLPVANWLVFDGSEENSYRSGSYRVTYTGGTGPHRADRLILDYVHAAKLLGFDTSRIAVETADKPLARKVAALGAVLAVGCQHGASQPDPPKASERIMPNCLAGRTIQDG